LHMYGHLFNFLYKNVLAINQQKLLQDINPNVIKVL